MRPFETIDEKHRDIASCETMPLDPFLSISNYSPSDMKSKDIPAM